MNKKDMKEFRKIIAEDIKKLVEKTTRLVNLRNWLDEEIEKR